jgi:hypothetical protein
MLWHLWPVTKWIGAITPRNRPHGANGVGVVIITSDLPWDENTYKEVKS